MMSTCCPGGNSSYTRLAHSSQSPQSRHTFSTFCSDLHTLLKLNKSLGESTSWHGFSLPQKSWLLVWILHPLEGMQRTDHFAVPGMFHHIYSLLSFKNRKRQKLRLYGEAAPTIDVMITTCKEDVDVVLDTVRAACNVDYPRERFRVVILDDGGDQELKKAITEMGMDYPNVHYFARVKTPGVPHHAKAGNLIAGTEFVTTLPGGAGEFIAALDADMIPEPEWLRALIGHLLLDPDMALACPPQMFYNVPSSDPLVQSLDAFIHVMEVTKDTCGVAWCTGSGYIIRRSALESIGGWPTGTLAEDTFTSRFACLT